MSYNQYSAYSGNPYEQQQQQQGQAQPTGYGASNPYGGDSANPYGIAQNQPAYTQPTNTNAYGQYASPGATTGQAAQSGQRVEYVQTGPTLLSNPDFLSRVEAVKADIRTLTTHVGQIASLHQRALSSPDAGSSTQLESMITQTQVLNTSIKDQIKFLEADAVRSRDNQVKNTQSASLKTSFQKQLQEYRVEEATYEKRYREQIARQYRIVNPEASDAEVAEAVDADWGNEGVFQTALKSNRSATANSVLGAVRARHNDIQKIERTMTELNALMEDLATVVVLQDAPIQQTEQHTETVKNDTEAGNVMLGKGVESARRARKLKWWCFWIVVLILVIIALVLGIYFGAVKKTS